MQPPKATYPIKEGTITEVIAALQQIKERFGDVKTARNDWSLDFRVNGIEIGIDYETGETIAVLI